MEVGLYLRDIVLDGDPATRRKKAHPSLPSFWPMSVVAKRLMDESAIWYGSRPRPRPHCIRRGPMKGAQQPPLFVAHVATVAHLSYC